MHNFVYFVHLNIYIFFYFEVIVVMIDKIKYPFK